MEIVIDKLGMNGEGVARPARTENRDIALSACAENGKPKAVINAAETRNLGANLCADKNVKRGAITCAENEKSSANLYAAKSENNVGTSEDNKEREAKVGTDSIESRAELGTDNNGSVGNAGLNKVTFVDFALPNERIEAEIVEEKSKFCKAKLIKVITPSEDRVVPPCPYFGKCGGCNLQHLRYGKQAEFKAALVRETLHKVGEIDAEVLPCISAEQFGYRNKAVFPLGKNIGMFAYNSHDIVEIDQCLLMNENINRALEIVKNWVRKFNIKTFDFKAYNGLLRYLVVRSVDNQTLVCLVATSREVPHLRELESSLCALGKYGLYLNINNQKNSIILGNTYIHIGGIESITLNEFGIDYSVDVASFLQVNNQIKSRMYAEVMANVGGGVVIDAYAGAGLLSAVLSKSANKVYSVEIVPQASQKARQLVRVNNIQNMEVINGDCTKILPDLIRKLTETAVNENLGIQNSPRCTVVLDPAHAGCSPEVVESVKQADKIVYIACNPIALAKDLKTLQHTHKILKIEPYDMFPQTRHIEVLAVLEKK